MKKPDDLFYQMYEEPFNRGGPTMMDWLLLRQDVLYHARNVHSRAFILYERMRRMMLVAWLVERRLKDGDDSKIPFQSREYHLHSDQRWRTKMMRRRFWNIKVA